MNESRRAMLELANWIDAADSMEEAQRVMLRGQDLILAALRASAPQGDGRALEPSVRSLEWEEGKGQLDGQLVWSSGDPWVFWIVKNPSDAEYVWCENFNIEGFFPCSPVRGSFETLDDAKAAAQVDYAKRILAALSAPVALEDMPETLGDVIPVSEMVDRLERRGAELNAHAITPNGQLMLKAAFYLKALTRPQPGGAVAGTERGGIDG